MGSAIVTILLMIVSVVLSIALLAATLNLVIAFFSNTIVKLISLLFIAYLIYSSYSEYTVTLDKSMLLMIVLYVVVGFIILCIRRNSEPSNNIIRYEDLNNSATSKHNKSNQSEKSNTNTIEVIRAESIKEGDYVRKIGGVYSYFNRVTFVQEKGVDKLNIGFGPGEGEQVFIYEKFQRKL